MEHVIALLEKMYNLTYISTNEDGIHLFTCNGCGKEYSIQVLSPANASTELQERQLVPDVFYKAFENEAD